MKTYKFTLNADKKLVEKLVNTDDVIINHIVLPKGEKVPCHYSNSRVHLIIIRGTMTLTLEDETNKFEAGTIVYVPFNTKMIIENKDDEILEFFVIKAPHPKKLGAPEEAIKC
ncbi:cupin domain-containing protein [Methanocaldococcus indicus]|uniref:cupin domain-containing protein n=1 Tax=Methanocaldococcus indicus TaxID=213231 RepID=UPI003C6D8EE1